MSLNKKDHEARKPHGKKKYEKPKIIELPKGHERTNFDCIFEDWDEDYDRESGLIEEE